MFVEKNGLIDTSIAAHFMNLKGSCQLCKKVIYSYDVDDHLLSCQKLNANDVVTIVEKTTKWLHGDQDMVARRCKTQEHLKKHQQMHKTMHGRFVHSKIKFINIHI